MTDVYATTGTFLDTHGVAKNLAAAVMRWEQVPTISLCQDNTTAFIHELPAGAISNVNGDSNYVRVQVLTPAGVFERPMAQQTLSSAPSDRRGPADPSQIAFPRKGQVPARRSACRERLGRRDRSGLLGEDAVELAAGADA
jgi:hypothetical protein